MAADPIYVAITPARDEEEHLEKTISSMVSQTVKPVRWIIVDEGSTDRTGAIAARYAAEHPWISVATRTRGNTRKPGGGVEAFCYGYAQLGRNDWGFIANLDADLSFEADYFEQCLQRFAADPKLGVAGGLIHNVMNGSLKVEPHPLFHVRGAVKIYRRACWDDIGGLQEIIPWDTVDEVKARMLGWTTRTFTDLRVIHHRYTGKANGAWKNAVKFGVSDYISGYHPLFELAKCVRRFFRKPYAVEASGRFYGFLGGYLKRTPRIDNEEVIAYLRREQLKRLLLKPDARR